MASVLETFMILFESDSKEVKKGAEEAKKSTEDLDKSLKKVDASSQRAGASFNKLAKQAKNALLAFVSVGAIVAGIKATAEYTAELGRVSRELKINIESLDAWRAAVKRTGGSVDGLQSSIKTINQRIAGTKRESAGALPILLTLASRFERMSKAASMAVGKQLGLDESTILFLQRGRREVEALIARQKELGGITAKDAEVVKKFNEQWHDTTRAFQALYAKVGTAVLPALTKVIKAFEQVADFFKKNSDIMKGALIGIGVAAAAAAIPILISFAPVILVSGLIAGLIAGFALLFEDVMNFYNGNKSLLGYLIEKWPILGEVLKLIEEEVKATWQIIKNIGSVVVDWYKTLWGIIQSIFSGIKNTIENIMGAIDKVVKAYQKVKSFLTGNSETKIVAEERARQAIALADSSPIASQTSNSINNIAKNQNKNTTVNVSEINVQTQATDANQIAGAIGESLTSQIREAQSNFDNGVMI